MRLIAMLCAATALAGCTTMNVGTDRVAERDPLEKLNRPIWDFNQAVDKVALKPASSVYRTVTPPPLRRGLSRVLANLSEPWSFVNNVLQGKMKRAGDNLARFVVNTTIGVGGLADQASRMGIKPADEDFGQTLAAWGVNGGPYLVLPLLGPSTFRDGIGRAVAFGADPYRIGLRTAASSTVRWSVTGFEFVSARSDLTDSGADAFLKTSLDPYAAARSAFLQRRRAEILNQEAGADTDEDAASTQTDDAATPAPPAEDAAPASAPSEAAPAEATPAQADAPSGDAPAADAPAETPAPSAPAQPQSPAPEANQTSN